MCVIAFKPREVPVDMEVLKHCWDKNDDGAGLMFAENGVLKIAKGFMKWRSFRRYIKRRGIDTFTDLPVAFHFRIATHGTVKEQNCHPFTINKNLAMMHNGIIRKVDSMIGKDEDISDSEFFAYRYVIQAFNSIDIDCLKTGMPINELFDEFIGSSRLLFMDNDGEIALVNERGGSWPQLGLGKDWWFSNTLWKPMPKTKKTTAKGASIVSYEGDFRIVEVYEHGRKIVKKYSKKTGLLLSTSYNSYTPPPRSGAGFDTLAKPDAEKEHVGNHRPSAFEMDDEDWYCMECHAYFARSEAKRSYWTNGLSKRIVDCPECGGADTHDVEDLHAPADDDIAWRCYLCGGESYSDELSVSGTGEIRCAICYSVNIYESSEQSLVDKYGAEYFSQEAHERGLNEQDRIVGH
jgi:hypothetical protein